MERNIEESKHVNGIFFENKWNKKIFVNEVGYEDGNLIRIVLEIRKNFFEFCMVQKQSIKQRRPRNYEEYIWEIVVLSFI